MQAPNKDTSVAAPEDETSGETVEELLGQLHSHDWKRREHARWQLVTRGEMAVFPLIDALNDPDWHVRWDAARALRDIADPRAAAALVRSLRDRRFGVRWLASDALIALKEAGLPALLQALVHQGDSVLLRNGAHHVLSDLSRGHVSRDVAETLKPVIQALEGLEPSIDVPMAARRALDVLPPRVRKGVPV
jgi:HEAT repeat protein